MTPSFEQAKQTEEFKTDKNTNPYSELDSSQIAYIVSCNASAMGFDDNTTLRMVDRVPTNEAGSYGLDAGMALSLGFAPASAKSLIMSLHSNYTREAINEVKNTIAAIDNEEADPESATVYWLAFSNVCNEDGRPNFSQFQEQLNMAQKIADDPQYRMQQAKEEIEKINNSLIAELSTENYGYGTQDGSIQGAYLTGKSVGICEQGEDFFVGTYLGNELNNDDLAPVLEQYNIKQIAPGFYVTGTRENAIALASHLAEVLKTSSEN